VIIDVVAAGIRLILLEKTYRRGMARSCRGRPQSQPQTFFSVPGG